MNDYGGGTTLDFTFSPFASLLIASFVCGNNIKKIIIIA